MAATLQDSALCAWLNFIFKWGDLGDNPGKFTFISNSGASTMDDIMLSYDLFASVLSFQVESHSEKNHFPLARAS